MIEQRSPEWFAARRGRLTASQAGAALGLAPYQSKDDCLRALVRSMHNMPSEFESNIATEYGTNNKDLARSAFELELGYTIKPAEFVPFEDWLVAIPDGYIDPDGLLEIKCPFGLRKDPAPVFKSIDDQPHYYAQIQMQLHITWREWCAFWQWSPHGSMQEIVTYNPDWIAENLPKLKAFWYQAYHSDPAEYEGPKRKIIDTPEASMLITEYDELRDAIDNAEARKKDILARLVEMSGGKDALISGRNLTLVKRAGSVAYAKAIKDLLPNADLEPYRGKPSQSWQVK